MNKDNTPSTPLQARVILPVSGEKYPPLLKDRLFRNSLKPVFRSWVFFFTGTKENLKVSLEKLRRASRLGSLHGLKQLGNNAKGPTPEGVDHSPFFSQ